MGAPHTFTIAVSLRGAGSDYTVQMVPQEVMAFSLHSALAIVAERPLVDWFPPDEVGFDEGQPL